MTMSQLFSSVTAGGITAQAYLLCAAVSLLLGALIAFTYTRRTRYTQSFVLTLILLPLTVQTVIMLVNGNVGTGVAVAGAFSLVRFRSVPGNAKDIAVIFLAMAAGLAATLRLRYCSRQSPAQRCICLCGFASGWTAAAKRSCTSRFPKRSTIRKYLTMFLRVTPRILSLSR